MTTSCEKTLDNAVGPLLAALTGMLTVQRYLHPARLERLREKAEAVAPPLKTAFGEFPAPQTAIADGVRTSMSLTLKAIDGFRDVALEPEGVYAAYRALRYLPYALETLYPAAALSPAVNRFFLEAFRHGDASYQAALCDPRADTGVAHRSNDRGDRGGYSLYVPENYDPARRYPAIVALHGGAGHGRGFLWTWLKEARSRGIILISPTARGDTWALMGDDIDSVNLESILADVGSRWPLDERRLLLTGLSDGGTFTYISGLRAASPFSHLAPIAASFHPMMLEMIDTPDIAKRPIYLTHGSHDWMFDVSVAHLAHQVLSGLGADITFREIPDLAHTYPRDENPLIADWFLGA